MRVDERRTKRPTLKGKRKPDRDQAPHGMHCSDIRGSGFRIQGSGCRLPVQIPGRGRRGYWNILFLTG
jgi:hypothetical protein